MMRQSKQIAGILLATVSFIIFGQGCPKLEKLDTVTTTVDTATLDSRNSGNGGGYDGKPLIFHDENESIICNGVTVPKKILVYYIFSNQWYQIENSPSSCFGLNRRPIEGVTFEASTNSATFGSVSHKPPKAYLVEPTVDADLPDVTPDDGVCMNSQGTCSLRAAIEQASITTFTEDVTVLIPAGQYKISRMLVLDGAPMFYDSEAWKNQRNHKITIIGGGGKSTLIDGELKTKILRLQGRFYDVVEFQGVGFVNGNSIGDTTAAALTGSAISFTNYTISNVNSATDGFSFKFLDCLFSGNVNSPALSMYNYAKLTIENSLFDSNKAGGISIVWNDGPQRVVNSTFTNNSGAALSTLGSYDMQVQGSYFYRNLGIGVNFTRCVNCEIQNSIFFENQQSGIRIDAMGFDPKRRGSLNVVVRNSTLLKNGLSSGGNFDVYTNPLDIAAPRIPNLVLVYNSVFAVEDITKKNCDFLVSPYYGHAIISYNSLFDDRSCGETGVENIYQSPDLLVKWDDAGKLLDVLPNDSSPLIDKGSNLYCTARDIYGVTRPIDFLGKGAICDIGAVERSSK